MILFRASIAFSNFSRFSALFSIACFLDSLQFDLQSFLFEKAASSLIDSRIREISTSLSIFITSLKSFNAVSKLEDAEDPFALPDILSTRVRAIKITFIAL